MARGLESEDRSPEWYCGICDQKAAFGQRWFALAQNRLEDRLSIFHPGDDAEPGRVHYACSPAHVRELVVHWMVTGSLDYPFAEPVPRRGRAASSPAPLWEWNGSNRALAVPIGELAVDREAVQRLLRENPAGLEVILDELNDALEKSIENLPGARRLAEFPENLIPHI